MSTHVDFNKLCRLCSKIVKLEKDLINIFDNDENCSLAIRIMACSALEVNQTDALPKNICTTCRYNLEKFYLFRKKSKNVDTKLRRHLRLINAGKLSYVFEEDDEDHEEYEECLAFIAKCDANEEKKYEALKRQFVADKRQWDLEKSRWEQQKSEWQKERQEMENLSKEKDAEYEQILSQANLFESEDSNKELSIKHEPIEKEKPPTNHTRNSKQSSSCLENEEDVYTTSEYNETLFVYGENNSEDYELITDDTNNYSSMFDEADETDTTEPVVRDRSNYILCGNDDDIEIAFAEGEGGNVNVDEGEDYTNAEYLEIDDDDTQEEEEGEEEIIPLEYSSISKVIRNTIASCSGITQDHQGIDCRLFKINGKSTKIAIKTDANPEKVFYLGIQENNDDEGDKLKAYACNTCEKYFKTVIDLNKHNLKVHENKQGRNCEYCNKWFPSNSALLRHVRVHTGEKPYSCEECGKSFCQKEILKRHKMIHTGERPHICSFCGKGFVQRDILKQHINRKHSANPVINLHKCQLCSKTFYHASGLSRHSLVHTGRKFTCEFCSKSFSDKSAMKRHVGSLHTNVMKMET